MARPYVRGLSVCVGCGRLLRPSYMRAADFDVTTAKRFGGDSCRPCYEGRKKAVPDEALEAYLNARRRRGIPADGLKIAS